MPKEGRQIAAGHHLIAVSGAHPLEGPFLLRWPPGGVGREGRKTTKVTKRKEREGETRRSTLNGKDIRRFFEVGIDIAALGGHKHTEKTCALFLEESRGGELRTSF